MSDESDLYSEPFEVGEKKPEPAHPFQPREQQSEAEQEDGHPFRPRAGSASRSSLSEYADEKDPYRTPNSRPSRQRPRPAEGTPDGMGIASFVLGICSIVTCCCCLLGLPASITGLILGINSQKKQKNWAAQTGIILCSIAIGLTVIWLVLNLVTELSGASSSWDDF